jgi:hypothetical protein
MNATKNVHRKSFVLFILFATVLGCTHQEVVNSPCSTLNATFDIKPRTDLALAFGNDAIKAAVDAMTKGFAKGAIKSVSKLTDAGKNAAVGTAKANGKTPSPVDVAELEKYLSKDVAPAIKQNPTCNFTVSSVGKPYVGIEKVALRDMGDKRIPTVWIKNTGQMEAKCHVTINLILDGKTKPGITDLRLGPSQTRSLSLNEANLPTADIEAGKTSLLITVVISYPLEIGGPSSTSQETWRYEHAEKDFKLVSQQ